MAHSDIQLERTHPRNEIACVNVNVEEQMRTNDVHIMNTLTNILLKVEIKRYKKDNLEGINVSLIDYFMMFIVKS